MQADMISYLYCNSLARIRSHHSTCNSRFRPAAGARCSGHPHDLQARTKSTSSFLTLEVDQSTPIISLRCRAQPMGSVFRHFLSPIQVSPSLHYSTLKLQRQKSKTAAAKYPYWSISVVDMYRNRRVKSGCRTCRYDRVKRLSRL